MTVKELKEMLQKVDETKEVKVGSTAEYGRRRLSSGGGITEQCVYFARL